MWKLQHPWKKYPLFPSNPPLKVEVLSSPPFLKIWLEVQPPPSRNGGAHYDNDMRKQTFYICFFYICKLIFAKLVTLQQEDGFYAFHFDVLLNNYSNIVPENSNIVPEAISQKLLIAICIMQNWNVMEYFQHNWYI